MTSDEPELKARLEKMLANRRDCYSKANIILQDATLHTLLKRLELRT